jgi:hypothetical protein
MTLGDGMIASAVDSGRSDPVSIPDPTILTLKSAFGIIFENFQIFNITCDSKNSRIM